MADSRVPLTIRHHTAADLPQIREHLLRVYAAAHHDRMDKPWFQPPRFWRQVIDHYVPAAGFGVASGWMGDAMVGYAMGSQRTETDTTWKSIHRALPEVPAGGAIYAFLEFAVHPDHQGHGYGRRIHDALLGTRPEAVAHLLVLLDNIPARSAYRRWGWVTVETLRPLPTAPAYGEAMALRLPQLAPKPA